MTFIEGPFTPRGRRFRERRQTVNYVGMTRFAWAFVLPEFFKNLVWYARIKSYYEAKIPQRPHKQQTEASQTAPNAKETKRNTMSMNANLAMNDAEASRPRGWSSLSEGSYSVNRESAETSHKKSRCNMTPSQQAVYNGSYSGKQSI
jgi:hypothetical protein